jgi:hypothetical protein
MKKPVPTHLNFFNSGMKMMIGKMACSSLNCCPASVLSILAKITPAAQAGFIQRSIGY